MWGFILIGISSAVALIGIFTNNRAKPPQRSVFLGLNDLGATVLLFAFVGLVVGTCKEVSEARQKSTSSLRLEQDFAAVRTEIDAARRARDEAERRRLEVEQRLAEKESAAKAHDEELEKARQGVERLEVELTGERTRADELEQHLSRARLRLSLLTQALKDAVAAERDRSEREIDQAHADQWGPVWSGVTGKQLNVKPGDRIRYELTGAAVPAPKLQLLIGSSVHDLDPNAAELRVAGKQGSRMPVSLIGRGRLEGVKLTVSSSDPPDLRELVREVLGGVGGAPDSAPAAPSTAPVPRK